MLKLPGGHDPVDLGSPMLVTGVACRGGVLLLRLQPTGAKAHPSCHGWNEPTVTVRCRLDHDPTRDLAHLERWRVNHLVVRAALEPARGRVSLWRPRDRRVELTVAQSRR
jgi:hypothetical protein